MPWKEIKLAGDAVTDLTGTAYRMLIVDSAGSVTELAHGTINYVLTSGGPSANPSWQVAAGGAHALDAGQTDVEITTPAESEVLAYTVTGTKWINKTAAEAGLAAATHASAHQDGGADEISVASLSGLLADGQTPLAHKTTHESGGSDALSGALDLTKAVFSGADPGSEIVLTPKVSSASTVEGTIFYDSDDNHLYCYVV